MITPRPPLICDPRLLPSASLTALPLSVHLLLHYLSISGEDAPQRSPLTQSVCAGAFAHSFPLLLKPPIAFLKFLVELNDQALFPQSVGGCPRLASRRRPNCG